MKPRINNNKSKTSPLRGTSDKEYTPFYLHTHGLKHKKLTNKIQNKKLSISGHFRLLEI